MKKNPKFYDTGTREFSWVQPFEQQAPVIISEVMEFLESDAAERVSYSLREYPVVVEPHLDLNEPHQLRFDQFGGITSHFEPGQSASERVQLQCVQNTATN